MSILKGLYYSFLRRKDPISYARKIGVKVGKNCRLFDPHYGSEPYLIEIGDHVEVTSEVTFLTHDGSTWLFRDNYLPVEHELIKVDRIQIKDNCFIGMRSTILPGVIIGPNSIVGTCSVVTKNVPPNTVVAGNPARVICTIDEYKQKILDAEPKWDIENFHTNQKQEILRFIGEKYGI